MEDTLQLLKPSANSRISAITAESGTTMEMGLNIDFRLSGSSVRPAYPETKAEAPYSWSLQTHAVVDQRRPTRIHGDEDAARRNQTDVLPFEQEATEPGGDGSQDGEDLLGDHR